MPRMFDAANPSNIPQLEPDDIVGGYINGRYEWTAEQWARFDGHVKVEIAIYIPGQIPSDAGDVLDIEAGDVGYISKTLAKQWIIKRQAAGIRPTIYTSKSGLVVLGDLDCDWWLADPDIESPHLLPGTVATQWYYPGGFDISEVIEGWPAHKTGGTMPGQPGRPAKPCGGIKLTSTGKGYWLFGQDGGVFAYGDAKMMGNPVRDLPEGDFIIGFDSVTDDGYVMVSEDYNVYNYGNVPFLGHP